MRRPDGWINYGDLDTLRVNAQVETPSGWLNINDGEKYRLEQSSIGDRSISYRRKELSSPHIPGTWLISAQPENVTETVCVWVSEFDQYALHMAVEQLEDAFSQAYFKMRWQIDVHEWAWSCQLADYQITTDRDMLHATMAKFTAKVPRHPETVHGLASLMPKMPTMPGGKG